MFALSKPGPEQFILLCKEESPRGVPLIPLRRRCPATEFPWKETGSRAWSPARAPARPSSCFSFSTAHAKAPGAGRRPYFVPNLSVRIDFSAEITGLSMASAASTAELSNHCPPTTCGEVRAPCSREHQGGSLCQQELDATSLTGWMALQEGALQTQFGELGLFWVEGRSEENMGKQWNISLASGLLECSPHMGSSLPLTGHSQAQPAWGFTLWAGESKVCAGYIFYIKTGPSRTSEELFHPWRVSYAVEKMCDALSVMCSVLHSQMFTLQSHSAKQHVIHVLGTHVCAEPRPHGVLGGQWTQQHEKERSLRRTQPPLQVLRSQGEAGVLRGGQTGTDFHRVTAPFPAGQLTGRERSPLHCAPSGASAPIALGQGEQGGWLSGLTPAITFSSFAGVQCFCQKWSQGPSQQGADIQASGYSLEPKARYPRAAVTSAVTLVGSMAEKLPGSPQVCCTCLTHRWASLQMEKVSASQAGT